MTVGLLSYNIGSPPVGGGGTAPVNTAPPTITGAAVVDQTLSATSGTWTGAPPTYLYQWQRGVADVVPSNTDLPLVTGAPAVGSQLTTTNGIWLGSPAPTFTRDWKRDGVTTGSTGLTYTLTDLDLTKSITCTVTATNLAGTANATSLPVGPVTPMVATKFNTAAGTWAGITFSNGDLTIASNTVGGTQSARSVKSRTSGKVYCEVKVLGTAGSIGFSVGPANAAEVPAYPVGVYTNDAIGAAADGQVWMNGANPPNSPVHDVTTPGDTQRVAIDFDNKLIWFAANNGLWNNVSGGDPNNPAAAGKGISFASMNPGPYFLKASIGGYTTLSLTANFGASAFAYSAPAGYGIW